MHRVWIAFAVLVLLSVPALGIGWLHDDFIQREMLTGSSADLPRGVSELYCFAGGPDALAGSRWEAWWRSPQLTTCFFRPLSSLTLALDHRLGQPLLAHLHGLLWLLAACAGVAALAWILFGPSVAALAALIYGVSSYTSSPVAWVAARHAAVSAALVAWGLCAYVRSRRQSRSARLGLAVLTLALLGGEGALGGLGFAVAYELLAARDTRRVRALHIAAAAALGAAYVLWYARSGYGTAGAGAYLDPLHHTGEFLAALPGRLLCLIGEAVLGAPSTLWSFSSRQLLLCGAGALGLLLALAALRGSPRAADPEQLRILHFLGVGALLCAIPAAAAILGGRVLLVPGIGLSIVFAAALTPRPASNAAIALAVGLLLLGPLARLAQIFAMRRIATAEQQLSRSALTGCEGAAHYLLLGTDEFSVAMYAPYLLAPRLGQKSWQQLTLASADIEVSRPDARMLRLRASSGHLLSGLPYTMNRPQRSALTSGMQLPIAAGTIHIEAAEPAAISALRIELPVAAEDRRFCWLRYDGQQLIPLALPPVGGALRVPHVRGPMAF